ncbi:50S ribosomal protein L20 [Candidatus Vidania fulgoroideae]|uniref:50S ribosomal protein L20 n=1 Tax=Candidatus Vidania fulgoroideorum TaxID=881286 RepID=A0A974X7H5_9PROT|nr:50S ribosomal protein L20 [Candidatus Vidania fulgoroideae]
MFVLMPRVKSSPVRRQRHKKLLKLVRGFIGRRRTCFRIAKQAHIKACLYARRDRKKKRAVYKRFCINAVNFYLRCNFSVSYSIFIAILRRNKIYISIAALYYLACVLRNYRWFALVISCFY